MNHINKAILLFGLFCLTLVSNMLYTWALGLLLLIVYIYLGKVKLKKEQLHETLILLLLLLFAVIRFQLFLSNDVLQIYEDAFLGNLSRFLLCIGTWFLIRTIMFDRRKSSQLFDSIKLLLEIHVSAFFLQFIVYLITGYYIDLFEFLTGNESRYRSFTSSLVGIGSFRPTGFFDEPSTYFASVLPLSIILLLHESYKKNYKLLSITIISMYLSYSTAAIIIATLFVIYIIFSFKLPKKFYFIVFFIFGILVFFAATNIFELYNAQLNKFNSTSISRYELIEISLNRKLDENFFGLGPFAIDKDIAQLSTGAFGAHVISSISDAGLLVFLWIQFKYLGIFFFLLLCFLQYKQGKKNLIFFLLLSLTKLNIFIPFFAMYYAITLSKGINFKKSIIPAENETLI